MASDTGSCADGEGFLIPTDKTSSTFQEEDISSERRNTFPKPFTLRPIVTCSSPSPSFSSSSAASFSSSSAASFSSSSSSTSDSPCSVFRASKSVEKGSGTDNILNTNEEPEICTTPKAKEYKIPEHLPCPPAPRKRRVSSRFHSVPLTGFFIPPDLDSMFSMQKIPVNM